VTGKIRAAAGLMVAVFADILQSSVAVARVVARPSRARPAIVAVPLDLRSPRAIAAFASLVSLAPGATSLHIDRAGGHLYVHLLDSESDAATIARLKSLFERRLRTLEA
jgi:multisubunit Na+/H+ antiporter MnhE subunit